MRINARPIENKILYDMFMIRGDTETFTVKANFASPDNLSVPTSMPFVSGDEVYFTIKFNNDLVLQKIITNFTEGSAIIELSSSDTRDLKVLTYKYDIRLKKANGVVVTLVYPANFEIERELSTI
jgi:hypothetical protein